MAVSISGSSGTWSHGSPVTLSGSGFGAKATAAPNLWDTVDNQSAYTGLADGATIPVVSDDPAAPWIYNNWLDPFLATIEKSDTQRHANSTMFYKAQNMCIGGRTMVGATKLYMSWWQRSDTDLSGTTFSAKFLRLSNSSFPHDAGNRTLSWTQEQFYVYDNNYYINDSNGYGLTPINTWHFLEVFADQNAQIYWIKVDNVLLYSSSSNGAGAWNWDYMWLIGWDTGPLGPDAIISIDDVYLDKTPERVILGNAATYAACTHIEMLIPTAWSGSSISLTVNKGSFAGGSTAYVYVFDSTNTPNSAGFAITLDAGGGGGGGGGGGVVSPNIPRAGMKIWTYSR